MSEPLFTHSHSLSLVLVAATRHPAYTLGQAAQLVGVHPERLRYYCQLGLLGPARTRPGAELIFDDDALYEVRRFEYFRRHQGVSRKTLRLLCGLWREVDRLQREVRFLRGS